MILQEAPGSINACVVKQFRLIMVIVVKVDCCFGG